MITLEITNFSSSSNTIVVTIFRYLCISEPPYNKVLGITNDILRSVNNKIYGKEPPYN